MPITRLASIFVLLLFASCSITSAKEPAALDQGFDEILSAHRAATIGAGIVRDGELVWTGYFGEQAPGVPITRLFHAHIY